MKKTLKFSLLSIFGIVLAICMAFTFINVTVKADVSVDSFELLSNALIRDEEPIGIRFEAGITETEKAALPTGAEFGIIVTFDTLLGADETLTLETTDKLVIPAVNWLDETPSSFGTGYAGYYGTVVGGDGTIDFEASYYSQVFVARGYLTVDGTTYYTNVVESTLAGAAKYAEDNDEATDLTDEILSANETVTVELSFDLNGGVGGENGEFDAVEFYKGEIIGAEWTPEIEPTSANGFFDGWYYDDETFEIPAFNGSIIKADTVVYAKWATVKELGPTAIHKAAASSTNFSYDLEAMTGDDAENAREGTYKYSLASADATTDNSKMLLAKNEWGSAFASGNYLVIDMYVSSLAEGKSLRIMAGDNWEDEMEYYDNDKILLAKGNFTGTKQWVKAIVTLDAFIESSQNLYMARDISANPVIYISNISIITAAEYAVYEEANIVTEKISLSNKSGATLTKDDATGVFTFTKTAANTPKYSDLLINEEMFDGKIVKDNYIVIKMNSNAAGWIVADVSGGNGSFTLYTADTFTEITTNSGKSPADNSWFYAVYKCGSWNNNLGTNFGTSNGACVWTIESINVYTQAEYDAFSASLVPSNVLKELGPTAIYKATASSTVYSYEQEAMTGDDAEFAVDGTYKYSYTSDATTDSSKMLLTNSGWDDAFVSGNYLVIDMYVSSLAEGKSLRIMAGDKWEDEFEYYDADKKLLATGNFNVTKQWVKAIITLDAFIESNQNLYMARDISSNPVIYISNVSIISADGYAEFKEANAVPEIISLVNKSGATLTKDEATGVFTFTKTAHNSSDNYDDIAINADMFDGKIVKDNYIVIKMSSNAAGWMTIATSGGNAGHTLYTADTFTEITANSGKTPADNSSFYAVYKCGYWNNNLGINFGTSNSACVWTIESINVYTQAEYDTFVGGFTA